MTVRQERESGGHRPRPDETDELFGGAHPNPDRIGCPPHETLVARARARGSIDDPFYEHLRHCSECYVELRTLQEAHDEGAADRPVVTGGKAVARWKWLAAAAALVLVFVATLVWVGWLGDSPAREPTNVGHGVERELRAELDLRPFAVARSPGADSTPRSLTLGRGRVVLAIILPVGAEPGRYDIQMLDRDLRSQAGAAAEAVLHDGVTRLTATLDLRALAPGSYQLALRRDGETWRLFPADVR